MQINRTALTRAITATGTIFRSSAILAILGLASACAAEDANAPTEAPFAHNGADFVLKSYQEWSAPVHLGSAVNSSARELAPFLAPDGRSLYFGSNRTQGGLGQFDIWVSQRDCLECEWQTARNLGAPVNGSDNGGQPILSHDGHLLFWSSNREGSVALADGSGLSEDIWMAHRKGTDDFSWENPVNLGPFVNTGEQEHTGAYVTAAPAGHAHLYFARNQAVYRVTISRSGDVLSAAERVEELGIAQSPSVSKDGRELVFWATNRSDESGTVFPGADLWSSTRNNPTDRWSTPRNLGPPVNSSNAELEGRLSDDRLTLLFSAGATRGGFGLQDIWMSIRTAKH